MSMFGRRAIMAAGNPWYLPFGVSDSNVLFAYEPAEASDLADSYIDRGVNSNDATPGVAPTLSGGWLLNGINQYIVTPISARSGLSIVVSFSGLAGASTILLGSNNAGNQYLLIGANAFGDRVQYVHGNTSTNTINAYPNLTAGVLGMSNTVAYRNGAAESGALGGWGTTGLPIFIGCRNLAGSPANYSAVTILAMACYDADLTAEQHAEIYSKIPKA